MFRYLSRRLLWMSWLPFVVLGMLVAPGNVPTASAAQTMGNVVCVQSKSDYGAYVTVYGFNYSALVPRFACSTDYSIANAQAFNVPNYWSCYSQWGYRYWPGLHYFSSNFNTLYLTCRHDGSVIFT